MLKKYSQFFISLLFLQELAVLSFAWLLAYYMRFYSGIIPVYRGIPDLLPYIKLLLPIWVIWGIIFKVYGLYHSMRAVNFFDEFSKIVKASILALIIFITLTYLVRENQYSRLVFLYFWVLQLVMIVSSRAIFRKVLKFLRKKGYNLRCVLIAGAGELGQDLVRRIHEHPELGLKIIGFLTRDEEKIGKKIEGVDVIGRYEEIQKILSENKIDIVFIALPYDAHERIETILKLIGDAPVDIKVVPDLYQFATLGASIEELDGLPILNLQDSPMYGWNLVLKRGMDIIIAVFALLIVSPLMLIIAIAIKLSSPGPIFYTQERMGMDGKLFKIIKFRTMKVDAEKDTGPVWSRPDDERRTKIGVFLRKTSLDELPQFINVLKGDMSIVGPRPERPVFINEFRKKIPNYMLRHKVKAGITGWAQVNGWRGNTSLEKRIEHDLYYINHWSLSFDIKIIFRTVKKMFMDVNAY
jgi:Undecaprenyl-phosphate glucose phosphotransferase